MDSPEITIVETTPKHIRQLAGAIDEVTAKTAASIGLTPHQALWRSYKQSIICKTAFINGKIAAIWGISGVIFADTGQPWLVMSPDIEEYPFRVAFRYRKELEKMQMMFPILEEYVDETNGKAIRMLELMGFVVSKNRIPLGDAVLRRAERRSS